MKPITAATILLLILLAPGAGLRAFTLNPAGEGDFLSWPAERTTVFYRIGFSGLAPRPEAVVDLGRAFSEWEEKSRGEIAFIYEGILESGEAARDGHNAVIWVDDAWPYGPETAAVSTLWRTAADGRIEEVDIEFNSRDYDWSLPSAPDLVETALHEIGHLLGIGHSFNPGAVMHDTRGPGFSSWQALSRDDIEAISFLYPPRERQLFQYDLPVLFYPRYFPGESPVLPPAPVPPIGADRWITALGSIDLSGDGYLSEILVAVRDGRGDWTLEGWGSGAPGGNAFDRLVISREVAPPGEILALAGVDYNRDGISGQAAVVIREGGREGIYFFRLSPDAGLEAVLSLTSPPANNLIGMAALNLAGGRYRDRLLLLRSHPGQYSLHLHWIPREGETVVEPDPGVEIPLPGLQGGSRILGLAVLDADGDGRESDLVFLELTSGGEYWIHSFDLAGGSTAGEAYDVFYRHSARLPAGPAAIHPSRLTGLDLNRDGFRNQMIILAPGE